jgi:heptosyltransferase-1
LNPTEKRKIDPAAIKKVILVRLRRIGDVVMTTPAITALRKSLPSVHISYVIETPYRELIEGNPHVDQTIVIPRPLGTKRFLNTIRMLRKERYDVAIDFHGGPTASLITSLSGARQKIGYRIKYKSFAYDISLPRSLESGPKHSVENHIRLIKALGISVPESPPLLLPEPSESVKKKIHAFFSHNHLQDSRVVVIHVGAGNEFREWGIDNWDSLVSSLVKRQGVKIVLIGALEDEKNAGHILSRHPDSVYSQAGRLNLKELKELIARADLYIGPDSGPMHIAASTPTPILALFGPNLSSYNAPWQTKATIFEKELDCRPCDQRSCVSGDVRCMRKITAEEIYDACVPFLDHS